MSQIMFPKEMVGEIIFKTTRRKTFMAKYREEYFFSHAENKEEAKDEFSQRSDLIQCVARYGLGQGFWWYFDIYNINISN